MTNAHKSVGCGQSGLVYHLKPSVVLKLPWDESEADIEVEQAVYERLGPHPRILKYLGPGPIPHKSHPSPSKSLGIRLEYQAKGTLRQLILSGLGDVFPIKWARQVAEGLDYLHRNGIVQCDVSTSNILITDALDAVLCDFAASSIDGIKTNGVYYEQRCLRRYDYSTDFDHRDDLFAFGTVVYELSTRKRPYEDRTDEEVRQLYKKGEFPDVSHLEMGNIIYKCWRNGYENASEVLIDMCKGSRGDRTTIRADEVSDLGNLIHEN